MRAIILAALVATSAQADMIARQGADSVRLSAMRARNRSRCQMAQTGGRSARRWPWSAASGTRRATRCGRMGWWC